MDEHTAAALCTLAPVNLFSELLSLANHEYKHNCGFHQCTVLVQQVYLFVASTLFRPGEVGFGGDIFFFSSLSKSVQVLYISTAIPGGCAVLRPVRRNSRYITVGDGNNEKLKLLHNNVTQSASYFQSGMTGAF